MSDTPLWFKKAQSFIGLSEIKGKLHNKSIISWWSKIKAPFRDDETPWCAAFVGGILEDCNIKSTRSAAARSYLKWGTELNKPTVGCVVIFWRGNPSGSAGHVGFVAGHDVFGNLMVLGGNQGDKVSVASFKKERVLGYRWPSGIAVPTTEMPILASTGKVSTNEA